MQAIAFIVFLFSVIVTPAIAENVCSEVESRAFGRIKCTKDEMGYTLHYLDLIAKRITHSSGQYPMLIDILCHEGGTVREAWPRLFPKSLPEGSLS